MIRLTDTHALVTHNGETRVIRIPTTREVAAVRRAALRSELAARRLSYALLGVGRAVERATFSPGERHLDRVVRDCAVRRLDPATTSVRLIAADAVAEVLDHRRKGTA